MYDWEVPARLVLCSVSQPATPHLLLHSHMETKPFLQGKITRATPCESEQLHWREQIYLRHGTSILHNLAHEHVLQMFR